MFASPTSTAGAAQLDLYIAARQPFTNVVFPAMGNHECTGYTASNCGTGNADGITNNYTAFLQKMLAPLGVTKPYYTVQVASTSGAWTAKFVVVAGNAWDATQSAWFASEMAKPTTYTFVVRHEGSSATTAPGVTPSAQIMKQHPYTLLLAGHTHTFEYLSSTHEVITGNGGAPLTGSINYGYVIAQQRSDGAMVFQEFDYSTNAVQTTFVVKADGTPTQ
jgi:predicted phosphodiesterase